MQQSTCRTCRITALGLILAFCLMAGCRDSNEEQPAANIGTDLDGETATEAIRMVLNKQVDAWNQGSIRTFMEGYAQTDSLRFASGGNVRYGWDETLRRYQDTYGDDGMMGALAFDDLDIRMLSAEYALVFGRWSLDRSDTSGDIGGLFTLLFRNGPDGWQIVHDHTSSASAPAPDSLTIESSNGQSVE